MAATGINYFYNKLGLYPDAFKIYYDFNQSGAYVASVSGANSIYSGILSFEGGFWDTSGSGHFTGQYVQIAETTGLNSGDWTILCVYEKSSTGNGVIFSSYKTGTISGNTGYLGFVLGVNDANRLYFESYSPNGPYVFTFNKVLGTKNLIAVQKLNNIICFNCFNNYTRQLEGESFVLQDNSLFDSDEWYIGGAVGAPSYFSGNAFSGYIDEFIYLNKALALSDLSCLASGFYCDITGAGLPIYANTFIDITGYVSQLTGIQSGVTGVSTVAIGTITDACGAEFTLYASQDQTGIIYANVLVPLTGEISYSITGQSTGNLDIKEDFLTSLGMDKLSYLRYWNLDFSDLYAVSFTETGVNYTGQYDTANNVFRLNNNYTNSEVEPYLNGIAQFGSGYGVTGGLYNPSIFLQADYVLSGDQLVSTGFFEDTDFILYDVISGDDRVYITGFSHDSSSGEQNIQNYSGVFWFFNGQKLTSGTSGDVASGYADYVNNGANITFLSGYDFYDGATGVLFTLPYGSGFTNYTGLFSSIILSNFMRGTSRLWMNGQRQILLTDYIEHSKFDLLSSGNTNIVENNNLYDNNGMFWS